GRAPEWPGAGSLTPIEWFCAIGNRLFGEPHRRSSVPSVPQSACARRKKEEEGSSFSLSLRTCSRSDGSDGRPSLDHRARAKRVTKVTAHRRTPGWTS